MGLGVTLVEEIWTWRLRVVPERLLLLGESLNLSIDQSLSKKELKALKALIICEDEGLSRAVSALVKTCKKTNLLVAQLFLVLNGNKCAYCILLSISIVMKFAEFLCRSVSFFQMEIIRWTALFLNSALFAKYLSRVWFC